MFNEEALQDKTTAKLIEPPGPRRLSNVTLQPQGEVKGSEKNVQKEEIFLCRRLLDETSTRKEFRQTQWTSWNCPIVSMLQGIKRPVCGLVALCMAGQMLKRHDPTITIYESDEALLKVARNLGFTKQGEMFSAKQFAELAVRVYDCKTEVITDTLVNSAKAILEHLAKRYPVVVPYDTDRNYEPCKRNGHKAHWAILTGFVIGKQEQFLTNKNDASEILYRNDSVGLTEVLSGFHLNPSLMYVYAKQGKSARQQLWSLEALSASNANLNEVSPERDMNSYLIPKEGIKTTLSSQSVLLYPKS